MQALHCRDGADAAAPPRQAGRLLGPADRPRARLQRARRPASAARGRHRPARQADRHGRGRVPGVHQLPLHDLQRDRVGRDVRGPRRHRPRLGRVPDRFVGRVRLVRGAGDPDVARARVQDDHGQLQPGDGLDRLRRGGSALLRDHLARDGAGHLRGGAVVGRDHLDGRADAEQQRAAAAPAERQGARHVAGDDRHGREPVQVLAHARPDRGRSAALEGADPRRRGARLLHQGRLPRPRPPLVRPLRRGDERRLLGRRPRRLPDPGGRGLARAPGRHLQVHRGGQGDRDGRRRARRQARDALRVRARRERRRALGRRYPHPPAAGPRPAHRRAHRGRHAEDRQRAQRHRPAQHPVHRQEQRDQGARICASAV